MNELKLGTIIAITN